MLQFPPWKLALIFIVVLWGFVMAAPNLIDMRGAPSWMPKKAVSLGLDLQGGVYLMMEVKPEEVINGRLQVFARDTRGALDSKGGKPLIGHLAKPTGRVLDITLTKAGADGTFPVREAMERLKKLNGPIGGVAGGAPLFEITSSGAKNIRVTIPAAAEEALMKDAIGKAETIIRRRVDPDGFAEIELTREGTSRIVLEAPGEPDPERLKNLLNRDGRMTFNLVESSPSELATALAGVVKPGYSVLDSLDGEKLLVQDTPEIVGSDIATASVGRDEANNPSVEFRLNGSGARKFFDTTRTHLRERFAIVLDGTVMSAPVIQSAIPGGQVQITGSFSPEEAKDLSAIIAAGEMPAKLQFLDQRVVSATLGKDSVRDGARAGIIGLSLVAIFMILAYSSMGVFAVMSLVVNIAIIFGALSNFGAVLTLPGIAGIILTIGIAVDANVLVFERIREEQRAGRSALTAVQAGYERALLTIIDTHVTTLLAAFCLFFVGSGPVKGFAATLIIGISSSIFTAFVVTRLLTVIWMKIAKPKSLAV
jgi:preprotein translocase subunit SecD